LSTVDQLDDFRNVLCYVWKKLGLPPPTDIQYDLAHWFQHGPRRRVIEAFRGVGKSWIASTYTVDCLRKDPTRQFLILSASKQRADDFSTFALRLIQEIDIFQHLRPLDHQRNSKISFDVAPAPVSHAPSVKSLGINSQITGSRASDIICDDVEVTNNSATTLMREKLQESIKECDAIIKPGGIVTFLGTPQTEQSIYNLLAERGYERRIWPARYPTPEQAGVYGTALAPIIRTHLGKDASLSGKPTDPKRFNEFDLMEREASYGRAGFALQFMLDTRLSDQDRYPLKLSDLAIMDVHPDVAPEKIVWGRSPELEMRDLPCVGFNGDRFYRPLARVGAMVPYQGSVLAIDPSGRGTNETGYCILKMLNGQLFLPELSGVVGGYEPATLEMLAERAKHHKVNKIVVETNFGDGMFSELLKPHLQRIYPCVVEEVKHYTQKEARIIDTLEPVMSQHRLVVDPKVIQADQRVRQGVSAEHQLAYQLFYQMSRLTRDRGSLRFDDRVDVLAIGVKYWTDQMGREVDKAMRDRLLRQSDEGIRKFIASASRLKSQPARLPSWLAQNRTFR